LAIQKKADMKPAEKKSTEQPPEPEHAEVQPDGSILITGSIQDAPTFMVKLPMGWVSTLKVELLPHEKHKNSILRNDANAVSLRPSFSIRKAGDEKEQPLPFRFADADRREPIYRNGFDLLGIREVWRTAAKEKNKPHMSLWWLEKPFQAAPGDQLGIKFPTNLLGCVRISVSPAAPQDIHAATINVNKRQEAQAADLPVLFLRSTGWSAQAFAEIKQLEQQYHECRHGKAFTMISQSATPLTTRVLARGNWQDESGEIVQPAVPRFLANGGATLGLNGGRKQERGSGERENKRTFIRTQETNTARTGEARQTRLDLANWLTSAENPLTARVFVNRLWKLFFGAGLSNQLDDLGARGEWPTHPELLDWLAVEFRESGWNVKHMVKLMVASNTYRQSAAARMDLREIDPNNRLLAAQSPRRLEAEFIRDQALFVSGLLNPELGGPSAFPYQPAGYYAQLQFPDRDYFPNRDDRQYRRGVYSHWQRTYLHPMLANFDAPPREECTACRTTANTPQQALTLLNDPTLVEAARELAQHVVQERKTDAARLERAFWHVLSRAPKAKEMDALLNLLANQRAHYARQPEEARKLLQVGFAPQARQMDTGELAAWTNVTRVLLNLHETITRY
jgi:hypothetical protein